jgi:hypothetical protein
MIVRAQAIVDYTTLSETGVPIGAAETIWESIARCRDRAHYDGLRRSQVDWLTAEITPTDERSSRRRR